MTTSDQCTLPSAAEIIEREFRRAAPSARDVRVTMLPDDEAIEVVADGQTYHCHIGSDDDGFVFEDNIKGGNIPKEYIPAIEKGFREQAESGYLVGFPIIDFTVELYDGAYHDVDSSAIAFEIAGRGAMREVAEKSGIKLLEPIMKVEVVTPEDFMGDVIGDLNSRRGQIQGTDSRGNAQVVEANVPLANMFGYVNELRSFTQGRAQYTMQFSHYDEVPANVAAEVKEKLA